MTSTGSTSTHRTGHLHRVGPVRRTGLWDALALATRDGDDDLAESRRRLAALRLRRATASLADYEPCA